MPVRSDYWPPTSWKEDPKMVLVNGKLIYPSRPGGRLTRLSYRRAKEAQRKESQ